MAVTKITTRQLGPNSVNRNDVDSTTTGVALITKVVAGTNMSISQTGVDPGTGDVTINCTLPNTNYFSIDGGSATTNPSTGAFIVNFGSST